MFVLIFTHRFLPAVTLAVYRSVDRPIEPNVQLFYVSIIQFPACMRILLHRSVKSNRLEGKLLLLASA